MSTENKEQTTQDAPGAFYVPVTFTPGPVQDISVAMGVPNDRAELLITTMRKGAEAADKTWPDDLDSDEIKIFLTYATAEAATKIAQSPAELLFIGYISGRAAAASIRNGGRPQGGGLGGAILRALMDLGDDTPCNCPKCTAKREREAKERAAEGKTEAPATEPAAAATDIKEGA